MAETSGTGGIEEIGDLAEILREMAFDAWNAVPSEMRVAETVNALPLAASLQGPQAARRIFVPEADPYALIAAAGAPLRYAATDVAGLDLVRITAESPVGVLTYVDAASFTLVVAPAEVTLAGNVLRHDGPLEFQGPDADGWLSTKPDLPVDEMPDWDARIDAMHMGTTRLILMYKTFPSARVFTPNLVWF